ICHIRERTWPPWRVRRAHGLFSPLARAPPAAPLPELGPLSADPTHSLGTRSWRCLGSLDGYFAEQGGAHATREVRGIVAVGGGYTGGSVHRAGRGEECVRAKLRLLGSGAERGHA